jgi:hypothetical protein
MDSLFSKMVKAGKTTYFVDVKEAKNSSKYITITESKLRPDAKEGEKKYTSRSVMIFDNTFEKFRSAFDEAAVLLKK